MSVKKNSEQERLSFASDSTSELCQDLWGKLGKQAPKKVVVDNRADGYLPLELGSGQAPLGRVRGAHSEDRRNKASGNRRFSLILPDKPLFRHGVEDSSKQPLGTKVQSRSAALAVVVRTVPA